MASSIILPSSSMILILGIVIISSFHATVSAENFNDLFDFTWGDTHGNITDGGKALTLSMDTVSGAGFLSKKEYHFARFDVDLKLAKDSSGIVTTFYLSSGGEGRDEIDLEFLGNVSGNPFTLHTNIYANGKGQRERGFHLWFDPTEDYHHYSIVWNQKRIIFFVDDKAIRVHENLEHLSLPFPTKRPMRIYGSIWNAEEWATLGRNIKTDWSKAPFTVYYKNIKITTKSEKDLTEEDKANIKKVEKENMIYNHCDFKVHPLECKSQL